MFLKLLIYFSMGKQIGSRKMNFLRDFSNQRREELRRRGQRADPSISISITFSRGGLFTETLPPVFTVIKRWTDKNLEEEMTIEAKGQNLEYGNGGNSGFLLQVARNFLSRYKYVYIPAIKDLDVFQELMKNLQYSIFDLDEKIQKSFNNEVESFNRHLSAATELLKKDFSIATGISLHFSLPSSIPDLFQSIRIETMQAEYGGLSMNIDALGDGLRLRMIPTILDYIASKSKHRFLWGFEEPENSMEFRRASEMFERCAEKYQKNSQIFITTHSPAFISTNDERCSLFRAIKISSKTVITNVDQTKSSGIDDLTLAEELGHIAIMSQFHQIIQEKIAEAAAAKIYSEKLALQAAELEVLISNFLKPVVITEGKTDVLILSEAWDKLFPEEDRPFDIISCDTTSSTSNIGGSGGVGTLSKHLCSIFPSAPRVTIGIFDNDADGQKSFHLDRNFTEHQGSSWVKAHTNQRAFAILLPPIADKQKLIDARNFPIEFMFDEIYLKKNVGGYGLRLIQQPVFCNGIRIDIPPTTDLLFVKIDSDSKLGFAQHVVPSSSNERFPQLQSTF